MYKSFLACAAVLAASQIPMLADVIPPGTEIHVRPEHAIEVSHWDRGRIYPARVTRDVVARDGDVAIPAGSYAELIVRQTGEGQYTIDLESVTVKDRRYVVDTAGPQYNMPEASYRSGSGVVGAIAGAIAGANGEQVEAHGGEIRIPAGTMIEFHLQQPLRVATWGDPGYQRGEEHYHHDNDWYR